LKKETKKVMETNEEGYKKGDIKHKKKENGAKLNLKKKK